MRTRAGLLLVCVVALAGCTGDPPEPAPTASGAIVENGLSSPSDSPSHSAGPASPTASAGAPRRDDDPPVEAADPGALSALATLDASAGCAGTLIDTGAAEGPAYLLTAGRCVGGTGRSAHSTTLGAEWAGGVEFLWAGDDPAAAVRADVVEIAYETMRHADVAIVRLDATLGELEGLGVKPLAIGDEEATDGVVVVEAGVARDQPSGDGPALRQHACTLAAQHTVIETAWLWFDVWSTDCAGNTPSVAGSPLLTVDDAGSPTAIVAMTSASSDAAAPASAIECGLGRPCAVRADGAVRPFDRSSAQSVAGIGLCFDEATGRFSIGGACPLPVSGVWTESGGGSFRGGGQPDAAGRQPEVSLVAAAVSIVRTVVMPLGDGTACLDKDTYDDSVAAVLPRVGQRWERVGLIVPVDLPESEGRYLMCAVRGERFEDAASILYEVDRTPPTIPAGAAVERLANGGVLVRPHLDPPELSAVRFTSGPRGETECTDRAALRDFFLAPLVLRAEDLPAVYCIYGMDVAGNPTPVSRIDIPVR